MSRFGEITLPFAGEDRVFRLGLGERRAIEEKCDAGLPVLVQRLAPMMRLAQLSVSQNPADRAQLLIGAAVSGNLGAWRTDDYRETIFRGLLGAGLDSSIATVLVREFVDQQPPMQSAVTAFQILMASLLGPEDEPLGETTGAPAAPKTKRRSRAAKPAGPTSTPPAR
ncbi:MAG TPA: gene transfer agent family protein [Caulobacteraceae bacterium]